MNIAKIILAFFKLNIWKMIIVGVIGLGALYMYLNYEKEVQEINPKGAYHKIHNPNGIKDSTKVK